MATLRLQYVPERDFINIHYAVNAIPGYTTPGIYSDAYEIDIPEDYEQLPYQMLSEIEDQL